MLEYGDFIILKDGSNKIIGRSNTKNIISFEEASRLLENGEILKKTINIDGEEVFVDINEIHEDKTI